MTSESRRTHPPIESRLRAALVVPADPPRIVAGANEYEDSPVMASELKRIGSARAHVTDFTSPDDGAEMISHELDFVAQILELRARSEAWEARLRRRRGPRVMVRRPRARQSRRLSAGHRRSSSTSRDGPGDDGPEPPRYVWPRRPSC